MCSKKPMNRKSKVTWTLKKFRFWVAFGLLCCAAGMRPANASAAAPVQKVLDSYAALRSFSSVVISPDGSHVAWVETIPAAAKGAPPRTAIFLTAVKNPASVTQVTAGAADANSRESDAAWSADSRHIAFVSDAQKAGQAQLYVWDVGTKSARKLTDVHGSLQDPRWAPDGSAVAFLFIKDAPKRPGPLAPTARDAGGVQSRIYEQRGAVADVASPALRIVSPADLYVYEYDWSPDNKHFVLTAAHGEGDDNWWIARLYTLSRYSGALTLLVKPDLQVASPRWSPSQRMYSAMQLACLKGSDGSQRSSPSARNALTALIRPSSVPVTVGQIVRKAWLCSWHKCQCAETNDWIGCLWVSGRQIGVIRDMQMNSPHSAFRGGRRQFLRTSAGALLAASGHTESGEWRRCSTNTACTTRVCSATPSSRVPNSSSACAA